METGKVVGVLTRTVRDKHALLEIVAFQQNGSWITDKNVIRNVFPPEGEVFGPDLFSWGDKEHLYQGSCLEFFVKESPIAGENERYAQFQIVYQSKVSPKWAAFSCSVDLIDQYEAINTKELQESLNEIDPNEINRSYTFYLEYRNKIYGPFKHQHGAIKPKSGKTVRCWSKSDCELVFTKGQSYLLDQPLEENGIEVDCMTDEQLVTWFHKEVPKGLNKNIKSCRELLLTLLENNLKSESLRKKRIEKFLDLFQLQDQTLRQLKDLAETIPEFKQAFERQLQSFKEELIESRKQEINAELANLEEEYRRSKEELERNKNKVNDEINDMNNQYEILLKRLDDLEKEIEYITENRDRLVKDFQLLIPALPKNTIVSDSAEQEPTSYSINQYRAASEALKDKGELRGQLQQIFRTIRLEPVTGYCDLSISLMESHRIIFVPSVQIPLAIGNVIGHTDCIIQQVEPIWLTYHHFRKAVLNEVLAKCREYPDRFIFLVLQDINMASPECYARPFLEVNTGIRHAFPGTDQGWPQNLWAFLTVLETETPQSFGLPLIKSTFTGCAGLPLPNSDVVLGPVPTKSIASKRLPLDTFPKHESRDSERLEFYFDE